MPHSPALPTDSPPPPRPTSTRAVSTPRRLQPAEEHVRPAARSRGDHHQRLHRGSDRPDDGGRRRRLRAGAWADHRRQGRPALPRPPVDAVDPHVRRRAWRHGRSDRFDGGTGSEPGRGTPRLRRDVASPARPAAGRPDRERLHRPTKRSTSTATLGFSDWTLLAGNGTPNFGNVIALARSVAGMHPRCPCSRPQRGSA